MAKIEQTKLLQFLRGKVVADKATAVAGLKGLTFDTTQYDGTIVVARYNAKDGETDVVKSVFGLYHNTDGKTGVTIFDNAENVESAIADLQKELDDTQTGAGLAEDGAYVKDADAEYISGATSLADADSKLNDAISALQTEVNTTQTGAGLNADGSYTAKSDANYISGATSLKDADEKLDEAIKAIADEVTANEVASADKTVTVTPSATGTDLAVNIDGKTIVKDATAGTLKADLTVAKLTDDEVTALADNNVKEAYKLIYATDATKTAIGDVVKIYKDSSLIEVYLGSSADTIDATTGVITKETVTDPQSLNFKYQLADGTYELVKIDVSKFLTQSEFKDGLQVSATGEVSVKVDNASEEFLTVSENGVMISGISDAISAAATTVAGANANKNVTVTSETKADGHTEYTFTETGLTPTADGNYVKATNTVAANLEALDTQVKANADAVAENELVALSVNGVDGTIVSTTAGTSASVTIEGDNTKVSSEYEAITYPAEFTKAQAIANTDTVDSAFKKVETTVSGLTQEVLDNEKVTEEAIEAICEAAGIGYDEEAGTVIGYNTEYNKDANYISGATSLANADILLDAAIKAVDEKASGAHNKVAEKADDPISVTSATDETTKAVTYTVGLDYVTRELTGTDSAGVTLKSVEDGGTTKLDVDVAFDFGEINF